MASFEKRGENWILEHIVEDSSVEWQGMVYLDVPIVAIIRKVWEDSISFFKSSENIFHKLFILLSTFYNKTTLLHDVLRSGSRSISNVGKSYFFFGFDHFQKDIFKII